MYLRKTGRQNKSGERVEYYQLAETRWDREKKRPAVHIIHNFGRADHFCQDDLLRLARSIERVCNGGFDVPEGVDSKEKIEIEWSKPMGGILAVRGLWDEIGIGEILGKATPKGRRAAAVHATALLAMVANRLLEPQSKLGCHERWMRDQVYFPEGDGLTVEHLYEGMDFLEKHADKVEEGIFFRTADLLNADVDLIFWDTTSVYFENEEEDEEEILRGGRRYPALRKRGHNKEGRGANPQVVVGLAVTREGLPVRSWVFPGNTMDATTVDTIKSQLRDWRLGRCILVGDAGMDSEDNRRLLSKGMGKYILAMPAGKLKEVHEEVLSRPGRYKKVKENMEVKEVVVGDGERRRRYTVCFNRAEAARQRHHRQKVMEELRRELAGLGRNPKDHPKRACELMASGRFGRYLTKGDSGRVVIDPEKVKKARRMDGRYVLLTNDDTLSTEDVGQGYKAMMIIESCFRRIKTTGLRIRPVYHWRPHRIISHVKICVLSLLLERIAELRTGETWNNIRTAVERLQAVRYRVGKKSIVQTTRPAPLTLQYFKTLGVSAPKRVLSIEDPSKT